MGAGVGVSGGMQGRGGQQDSQVYYDSTKGQYYTMAQPQTAYSPFSALFRQSFPQDTSNRNYINLGQNNNTQAVNSLQGYQAPQFQYPQNSSTAPQFGQSYNPYAQTQFGQMPTQQQMQRPQQSYQNYQQNPYSQQYYQGPFQQYGMGGKGGMQQPQQQYPSYQNFQQPQYGGKGMGGAFNNAMNTFSNQMQQRQQQYPGMSGAPGMGGKGGAAAGPQYQGGMGGKGKGNS